MPYVQDRCYKCKCWGYGTLRCDHCGGEGIDRDKVCVDCPGPACPCNDKCDTCDGKKRVRILSDPCSGCNTTGFVPIGRERSAEAEGSEQRAPEDPEDEAEHYSGDADDEASSGN